MPSCQVPQTAVPATSQSSIPVGNQWLVIWISWLAFWSLSSSVSTTMKQRWQMPKKSIHLATRTQKASTVYSSSVQLLDYGAMGHPCEMKH